jgi:hypothetical protein
MRKFLTIAFGFASLLAFTDRASAAIHQILNHSATEIEAFCAKVGGTFKWDSAGYYCLYGNGKIVVCNWGTNECYANRHGAPKVGNLGGANTTNFGGGKMPSKTSPKVGNLGGANTTNFGGGRMPSKTGAAGNAASNGAPSGMTNPATSGSPQSGIVAAPAKILPALGGGAFGGGTSKIPGLPGAANPGLPGAAIRR